MKFKFRPLQLLPLFIWLLPFFAQTANAEPTPGLATTYYTIDAIPPLQLTSEYLVCGSEIENNINRNYDGELYEDCTYDLFMVHMTGYIDIPEHQTIEFMLASDDGGEITIGGNTFGVWYDQGCTWTMSGALELNAESVPLELFMYENGGAACLMLAWKIDDGDWTIVPDEAFTQQAVVTTTTSSTTTTLYSTTTSTTTTEVSTTTSSSTTTLPTSTTTTSEPIQTSTTTLVENTTTSTTTTTLPTTTTTEAPYTPPQTTTTSPTIETQPVTTITVPDTTIDLPDTTEPETFTTYLPDLPEDIVEPVETTIPETVVPDRVDVILPDETEQPEDILELPEYTTETTLVEVEDSSPTTLPFIFDDNVDFTEISDDDFSKEIDAIFDDLLDTEDITEVLGSFLDADISEEQFETVLDTVFEDISDTEQATAVITSLLSEDLSEEELVSVMEAVFSEDASVEQMNAVVDDLLEADLSGEELTAVFDAVFDGDLSDEQTIELAQDILKGELDTEEFGTVIDAIFDEVVTDKVLIETFTAVLETELDAEKFEAVVSVLESEVISNEQVAEVVTLIIEQEGGVNAEQATELATSEKVLESIDGEQATEVFDAVVASEVSPEDGLAISEAVQEAPKKVRKAFEKELNVFEGVFDVYVPMGSKVPVGDRRVLVGVGAVLLSVPVRVRVG